MRWLEAIIEHVQALFAHADERERNSHRTHYDGSKRTQGFAAHVFDWILSEGSWLAVLVGLAIWGIWHLATKGAP